MPLGQGIGEMMEALRDRIEVSGSGPTWEVTAGCFDTALTYARERFDDPVVLARTDRDRWWPRVTLTVTTDPGLAASAPPLEELSRPPAPEQPVPEPPIPAQAIRPRPNPAPVDEAFREDTGMPSALEAIFDHQEQLRIARQRVPDHD